MDSKSFKCPKCQSNLKQSKHTPTSFICEPCSNNKKQIFDIIDLQVDNLVRMSPLEKINFLQESGYRLGKALDSYEIFDRNNHMITGYGFKDSMHTVDKFLRKRGRQLLKKMLY